MAEARKTLANFRVKSFRQEENNINENYKKGQKENKNTCK